MSECELLGFPLFLLVALGAGFVLALPIWVFAHESAPAWPVRTYFAFLKAFGYPSIKREIAAQTTFKLMQQFLVSWFLFFLLASLIGVGATIAGAATWHCT